MQQVDGKAVLNAQVEFVSGKKQGREGTRKGKVRVCSMIYDMMLVMRK